MIDPKCFLATLQAAGLRFFTGVPDSLLREFNACLLHSLPPEQHVIAANEGAAVGLAIGHFLASGNPALVYLQNSGLGNSVNPLVSLADPLVMGCPMLLLIGWRGELLADDLQLKDEPQHKQQGRITLRQLDTLEIPYQVIDAESDAAASLETAIASTRQRQGPVALVVRKDSFAPWATAIDTMSAQDDKALISREEAIRAVLYVLPDNLPIVSTTGMASRELFELRKKAGCGQKRDLLCVGGMGHAVSIAAGLALTGPDRLVVCLDGDGSLLMHLGALTNSALCPNLIHIVLNNGAHDSVGGQPTRAAELDLWPIATACGYRVCGQADTKEKIHQQLRAMLARDMSRFLEIRCSRGSRTGLGRPSQTPAGNRAAFMEFLKETGSAR
jgi:phosphonopyruvate decarboxylase